MATMKCPYCDQEISDKLENCNHCGAKISDTWKTKNPGVATSVDTSRFFSANTEPTNHEVSGSLKQKLRSNSEEPLVKWIVVGAIIFIIIGAFGSTFNNHTGSVRSEDDNTVEISSPESSSYFSNENYKDVEKILVGAGFTNIKFEVLDDLVTGWLTNDGAVEKVSIGGYTSFSTSDRFDPDTEIIITYHTFPMSESEKAAKESAESLQNISDETLEAIVGTYVGKNGSGLILYPDGSADYYWKDWDEAVSGNVWSYKNGELTVFIPKMYGATANVNATANLGEGNTGSFLLSSNSLNWDDEEYEKVSDVSVALTKTEYDKLIFGDDTSAEQQQSTDYECCGIVFEIPSYMEPESVDITDANLFVSDHCGLFFINGKVDGLTADQFRDKAEEATKNFMDKLKQESDNYTITAEKEIMIAGKPAYLLEYEGTFINIDGLGCAALIFNEGDLIASIAVFEKGASGLSCKNDFNQMLEQARLTAENSNISSQVVSSSDSMTMSQKNAVQAAQDYLSFMNFSRKGLIEQLSSSFGDGYSVEDATFAVDYLEKNNLVNWNEQAKGAAESYLSFMTFSRQELYDQLVSEYGEGFTGSQAEYALKALGY